MSSGAGWGRRPGAAGTTKTSFSIKESFLKVSILSAGAGRSRRPPRLRLNMDGFTGVKVPKELRRADPERGEQEGEKFLKKTLARLYADGVDMTCANESLKAAVPGMNMIFAFFRCFSRIFIDFN